MATSIGILFHDVARLLKGEFARRAQSVRLTLPQWRTLGALRAEDGQTQKQLADRLELSPMTMSGLLERLEAMGYVRRAPDPGDGRVKRVFIAPEGARLAREMRAIAAEVHARALAGLSPDEIAALESALPRIVENLSTIQPAADILSASDQPPQDPPA